MYLKWQQKDVKTDKTDAASEAKTHQEIELTEERKAAVFGSNASPRIRRRAVRLALCICFVILSTGLLSYQISSRSPQHQLKLESCCACCSLDKHLLSRHALSCTHLAAWWMRQVCLLFASCNYST